MGINRILNSANLRKAADFFTGMGVPEKADIEVTKRIVNCGLKGFESSLLDEIKTRAPKLIREIDGFEYIAPASFPSKLAQSAKSFALIPLDILNYIAKKFPNSALDNAGFIRRYRETIDLDNKINSLRGLYKNSLKFIQETVPEGSSYPTGDCGSYCRSICEPVAKKLNAAVNNVMANDVANYDTKKERFATRLVSGFTAAAFLGSDFFNKAIKRGKPIEVAQKEQHKKQRQEIKENIMEGITQFAVFSCFSEFVNKNPMAPAVLGMLIGIVSRVVSRKREGMPLGRIEAPDNVFKSYMPSIYEYIQSIKDENTPQLFDRKREEKAQALYTENKKPFLTAKKIIGFCAASIAIGFGLKAAKDHTKIGRQIGSLIDAHKDKVNAKIYEDVITDSKHLRRLSDILRAGGDDAFADDVVEVARQFHGKDNIKIGTDYRTMNLLGMEVRVKDVRGILTAPFRFVKELVSYPYKMAKKGVDAFSAARRKKLGLPPLPKKNILEDPFEIRNLYKRFLEFEKKYPDDDVKLADEFGKYVRQMRLASTNSMSSSKGDNSQIAVMAQLLGTLSGMWFNMNDEYNSSINIGKTKAEASKDARLRGINKFLRMSVQVIISGGLNGIFVKQYNGSIAGSAIIVAISTVLTDWASRVMSGMPSRKMTQEELKEYDKKHQEGPMKVYYNMIDKLAS